MEFISYAPQTKPELHGAREAPGPHDPTFLPAGIPAPRDDGGARHLAGMRLPDLALPATRSGAFNLSML